MRDCKNVLITTVPFAERDSKPIDLLNANNISFTINPLNKKLTESELLGLVSDYDAIIAGTEDITSKVLDKAKKLKFISRVGIGLDSVDLHAARNKKIEVSYTPDAPSSAVAELTIGLMISLLRSLHLSNLEMHSGNWQRFFGKRLSEVTVGIIGHGRIGKQVLRHLTGFNSPRVLINDLEMGQQIDYENFKWCSKEEIYRNSDIISLHLPLTIKTKNMIGRDEMELMKNSVYLLNTSRGGIINEDALSEFLENGKIAGAAVDVFMKEPYDGPLNKINNCLLTSHMGSMSIDCRTRMEIEATEEVIRFFNNEELKGPVPESEFLIQEKGL